MIHNILTYSVGSLIWGIFITAGLIGIFVFLIKGWYKDAFFKPITYVILGVLSLILIYNSTIICGAIAIKSDISTFEDLVSSVVSTFPDMDMTVDQTMSNEVLQEAIYAHPILNYFVGDGDFSGWKLSEIPGVMADTLKGFLNKIILKNSLWALGFTLVAAIFAIKTIGRQDAPVRSSRPSQRRVVATSRRSSSRRVSRR